MALAEEGISLCIAIALAFVSGIEESPSPLRERAAANDLFLFFRLEHEWFPVANQCLQV
jgi:hypothetical protein